MPRVLKTTVLGVMLAAGLAYACKKKDVKECGKQVQMYIIGVPELAELPELTELPELAELVELKDGKTCIKIVKKVEDGDETTCNIYIIKDGELKGLDLESLTCAEVDVTKDGVCITKVIDDKDGFHGVIIHEGEKHEFEDKESFDKYLEEHPELSESISSIKCVVEADVIEEAEEVEETLEETPAEESTVEESTVEELTE